MIPSMSVPRIVIDTNVFVAALQSRAGASFRLLTLVGRDKFELCLSVPLVLEYESVGRRFTGKKSGLKARDIDDIIDYLCSVAELHNVYFLWRPFLSDPRDDMVLELAVSANCDFIVSYNTSDFHGADQFGIRVVTAREFLREIGELA